jgi:hypothetical protein
LLEEVGAPLQWDPVAADGKGAYRRQSLVAGPTAGVTATISRHPTAENHDESSASPAVIEARQMEERLQHSLRQGGLLVLTTALRDAARAEAELLHRFGPSDAHPQGLQRLSVDSLLLRELRGQARTLNIDWTVVLRADAADLDSRDWRNLLSLVKRVVPTLENALFDNPAPLLIVNTGLLARYDLMSLLSTLEATAGRPGRTPSAWLLLPNHQPGVAAIDATPVPLVNASALTPLAQSWIANVHRATVAAGQ